MNNKTYATLRRVIFTVAMAAGVCMAAWGQETSTAEVQAGSGVTKIAGEAVSSGATVQTASGSTVTIEGAAPQAGKVARLKLTRKEDSSESEQAGDDVTAQCSVTSAYSTDGKFTFTMPDYNIIAEVEYLYSLSGDYVHFSYEGGYISINGAAEGETVSISFDPTDPEDDDKVIIPSGKYFAGQYTASESVTITMKENGDGTFTMPAKAVTVSAVLADQEEYTLDLTTTEAQTIPESVWLLLYSLGDDINVYETNDRFLDLNLDGKCDVLLEEDYDEATEKTTYSATRQPGADAITSNPRFAVSYVIPQQYNSVLFMLNTPKAILSDWITIGDGTTLVYNGQAQEPAVVVKDGEKTLSTETDYEVTYNNNKNACEATAENAPTITVTAKSTSTDYTGSATATFTIARKALKLVADKVEITEGEPLPDFTGSITGFVEGEGLIDTDVLTFSVDGTPSTKGEYAVTGKLNGETKGTYGQNYTFDNADANETAFTINPIPTCTLGGLIYMITSKSLHTAELKEYEDDGPTGELVIPASIKYEGTDYTVNSIGDGALVFCYDLTSVTIPTSVKRIGDTAFGNCIGLASVTIPDGVTSIGQCAFQTTSLASVTIPASVTSIGKNAFMDCQNLQSVTVYTASVPTSDGQIFTKRYSNVKVYVPSELVEAYKNDVNWSTNADIEAMVSITTQPTSSLELTAGDESGKLTVEATAADGHTLTYQWFANTSASNEGGTAISGATEANYTVPTTTADTYYYYCVVTATRTDKKFTATSDVATVTVKEKPKKTIEDKWITVGDGTTIVYNGQAQTPAVTVKDGATTLSAETDYEVTYSNNKYACEATAENAPTVTVTVKDGNDTYTGSASVPFAIGKATVKASGFTVKDKEKNGDDVTAVLITTNVMLDGVITGSGDKLGDEVGITGVKGTFEDANVGENKIVNLDYTNASLTGKDAGNYTLDKANSQQMAIGKILTEITVDGDGNVIEFTKIVIKDADGTIIGVIETTKTTKKAADGSATGTINETAKNGNENVFVTSEGEIKVVVANGKTTETTIRTDKDAAGNIIQTTETVKTTEKDADGNITVTIKEELTEANGQKIRYTETVKKTVKDADGNTTETINEIVSEPYLNPIRTIETKKEIVKTPDGQKTETINETVTEANGKITTTTIETKTDGSLQETKTVTHADKSVTETVIETVKNADGSKSITIINTEKDAGGETTETKEIHKKVSTNTETVEETIKAADGTTTTTTSTITKTTEWDGYDPIKHPLSEKTLKTVKNADESEIGSSQTVKRLYLDVHFNVYYTIETIEEKWKYPDGSSIETKEVTETNAIGVVIKHSKKQTKTDALGNQTEISEVTPVNGSQDDISGVSNAQLGIQEGADRVSLVSEGTNGNMQQSINVSQGPAVQIAVMGAKAGGSMRMDFMPKMGSPVVYASNEEVRKIVDNSRCRARGTEDEMIEIVSGEEYIVLKDGPLVLTFDVEEGPISIENITLKDPDPNDLNLDGKVNAVDLVKAVSDGKTQAEIDEIVNSIMNIK